MGTWRVVLSTQHLLRMFALGAACAAFVGCDGGGPGSPRPPSLEYEAVGRGLPTQGIWKSVPLIADIDQDGFLDLAAVSRMGDGAHVWLGNGRDEWRDASAGLSSADSCGGGVAAGDINRDGLVDLAVAEHCHGATVYLGDGHGQWRAATGLINPRRARPQPEDEDEPGEFEGAEDLALGDVNEDGFLDLVVASPFKGGLNVYFGEPSGKSWHEATADGLPSSEDPEEVDGEGGGWAGRVLLQDMDGDGHLDVVATYYRGPRVWLGDGKGRWRSGSQGLPSLPMGPWGMFRGLAVGDINRDGRLDLVVASRDKGPQVFLQQADATWQPTAEVFPALHGGSTAVALGDLNGDGLLDLLVGGMPTEKIEDGYGLFVLLGDGKGGWAELPTNLPAKGLRTIWGITSADLNGDQRLDLAVTTGDKEQRPSHAALPPIQIWMNRSETGSSAAETGITPAR